MSDILSSILSTKLSFDGKAELKLSRALDDSTEIDWWFLPLTLFIPGFLAGVVLVVLHLHSVTPLFLKSGN